MRFLADENFPMAAVTASGDAGHDVSWVHATAAGMRDADVLAWALRERRVLLTFDKDFGQLARNSALPAECGIVLFRLQMPPSAEAGARLSKVLADRDDWHGHFSVVEPGRIRMRRL